jgi:hypothetical protein
MTQESKPIRPGKRIYLINRDFQLRYAGAAVFVGLVTTILTAFVILFPLYIFEILRVPQFVPTPFMIAMVAAVFLNICLVAGTVVVLTHKIAGPIYSIVRNFRRVETGFWSSHVQLRQDDEMRYLARKFNDMIDGIITKGKGDLDALVRIKALAAQLPGSAGLVAAVDEMVADVSQRIYTPERPRSGNE